MIGAARRYRELLTALLIERELEGGTLAEEIESQHVEELDRCWWAMTSAEQQDIERAISDEQPIDGPADLGVEDVSVQQGEHELPRKAA
jgi:hypothetical protein